MKRILNLCLLCIALMWSSQTVKAQVSFGQAEKFNDDWRFILEDATEATKPTYDDSKWPNTWGSRREYYHQKKRAAKTLRLVIISLMSVHLTTIFFPSTM